MNICVLVLLANLRTHFSFPLHCPFLTNLHALQNISTFPLQLATAGHVRCNGHTTADIPTANCSASNPCSTLHVVSLLVRVRLLARSGTCLQQPTLVVAQGLSIVSSVKFKPKKVLCLPYLSKVTSNFICEV